MASVSAPGLGSGLDVSGIVNDLIAAEGDNKTLLLTNKRASTEQKISAFGALKSALSSFQTANNSLTDSSSFKTTDVSSANKDLFTVSASGEPEPGDFDIEVRALAEAQKLLSPGYTNNSSPVGTGSLTISVGVTSFSVNISSENNTLEGIRDAINDASDNQGVRATILTVDDGTGTGTVSKLVFTSEKTGTANSLTITTIDDDGNNTDTSGLSNLVYDPSGTGTTNTTEINEAVNADVYIDGQRVISSTNEVVDAIEGVTIDLVKAEVGTTAKLSINTNTDNISSSVNSFINSYNALISNMNDMTDLDIENSTAGILLGDTTLLNIRSSLQREISATSLGLSSSFTSLVDIGVTTKSDGSLELDTEKFNAALEEDFEAISELFTSDGGVSKRIDTVLESFLQEDGVLDSKTKGLNRTVESIDDDLVALNEELTALEERLFAQFTTLDLTISQLQSTGDFLTQQFEALQGFNKKD